MKVKILIAIAVGLIYGVTLAARAQHSGPPGNSPEEECRRQCHQNHCDDWVKCIGVEDQKLCQLKVTEKELSCMRSCEPPRG
jgi:hypothetical protein